MNTGEIYYGKKTLETLKEAANYNGFLEKRLLAFIGKAKGIVDFGAGNGEFAERLRKQGLIINCVELDPFFRADLQRRGFIAVESISELDGAYQRIYTQNVLEHIEDDELALMHLHDKLENGGAVFIYVPAFMLLYSSFDKKIGHFRRYKKLELKNKLIAAGFVIEKIHYVDSIGYFAWLILKLFGRLNDEPNPKLIKLYDKWIFPLSRAADILFSKLYGKNLLAVARKI